MAELPSAFNSDDHEELAGFDAIPAGDYIAEVIASEMKDTKAQTGKYLQLTFKILEGDFVNRQLWTRLNLVNPNEKAVEIAQRHLATLCKAIGVGALKDSEEVHGKPMTIKVVVKAATAQYQESNEIKGYAALEGPAPAKTEGGGTSPTPDSGGTKQQPWDKK
jgi:hypothetical protein